jgi:hypothetical protein
MKRVLMFSAAAAAAIAAAVPARAGLAGNPAVSKKQTMKVPSQAQVVGFDDHGRAISTGVPARDSTTLSRAPEPGDDSGGARTTRAPEPGDDSGGHGSGSGRGH